MRHRGRPFKENYFETGGTASTFAVAVSRANRYILTCVSASGQGFQACLFHPNLGNEAVTGEISLDRRSLRFRSETVVEEIPIDQVVIELARRSDRISFGDSARPELRIFTLDQSILEHRAFTQSSQIRDQLRAIMTRRELVRRLRIVLYFLAGCLLLGWLGSWGTGAMVRSLARRVPPEWEQKFGDAQIEKMQSRGLLLDNSNEVAALSALAAPLVRVVPLGRTPVHFHIASDPVPNAFAIPGAHVIVNTGLLRMADRPEELLGVIAHELAHVTQKHHARQVIAAAGPILIFGVFLHSRHGLVNVLSAGAGVIVFEGFSQEFEQEADDVGWKYLVAANIDPQGMIGLFRKLQVHKAMAGEDILPQAFSSHPALDKRIARLEAKWKRLARKSNFIRLTNAIPTGDSAPIPEQMSR